MQRLTRPNFALIAWVLSIQPLTKSMMVSTDRSGKYKYCAYGALLRYGGMSVKEIKELEVADLNEPIFDRSHALLEREYGLDDYYGEHITDANDNAKRGDEVGTVMRELQESYVERLNNIREDEELEPLSVQEVMGEAYIAVA